jgi:hypothetical protein
MFYHAVTQAPSAFLTFGGAKERKKEKNVFLKIK